MILKNGGLTVLVLVVIFTGWWLFGKLLVPISSVGWDEGVHLLDVVNLSQPLRQGNFGQVGKTAFGQFFYPPGYPITISLLNYFGNLNPAAIRFWSLVMWAVCGVLVYKLTFGVSLKLKLGGVIPGVVAAGLFVSSPIYWIFGTQAMLEIPGVLGTLIVGWLVVKKKWFLVGLGIVGLHFIKYNYAMWAIGGVAAEAGIMIFLGKKRISDYKKEAMRLIAIFLPVLVMFVLWVLFPGRLQGYLHYFNDPNFYSYHLIPFWKHLVWFFPMAILYDYLASPWLGVLLVMGIYGVIGEVKENRALRVFGLIFLINLFFATIHFHNQQSRYIITGIPFLYILVGVGLTKIMEKVRMSGAAAVVAIIMVVLVGRDLVWNIGHVKNIGEHLLGSPIYSLSEFRDTGFDFDKSHWPSGIVFEEKPEDILSWIIDNTDPWKPLNYFGRANEVSPPALEYLRALARETRVKEEGGVFEYAITLVVRPGSILDSYDYRKMNMEGSQAGLTMILSDPNWVRITQREFGQLGASVTIWARF